MYEDVIHRLVDDPEIRWQSKDRCVCSATVREQILDMDRYRLSIPIYLCQVCGTIYMGRHIAEESMGRYYTDYFGSLVAGGDTSTRKSRLTRLIRKYTRGGLRVLDIGAGSGELLRRLGGESYATEINQRDRSMLESSGVQLVEPLSDVTLKFDVIVFEHILEHFINPAAYLRWANELLTPYGIVVIETWSSWMPVTLLGYQDYQDFLPHFHIHTFNPIALRSLTARCGLYPLELSSRMVGVFCRGTKFWMPPNLVRVGARVTRERLQCPI